MSVSINMPGPTKSPMEAIANAVQVAKSIYGMKVDSAALDQHMQEQAIKQAAENRDQAKFDQEQKQLKEAEDPNSAVTKATKADATSYLGLLANSQIGKKNPEAFTPLQQIINDPSTNARQVKQAFESSPVQKYVSSMANKDEGIAAMVAAMNFRNQKTEEKTDLNANSKYDKTIGPLEGTIQSANKVQTILNKLQNQDPNDPNSIKTTKLLRADLGNAIGSMFNNGKAATVAGSHDASQDTAFGALGDTWTKLSGSPTDTIPMPLIKQMSLDVNAVKEAAADNHDVQYQSFREGLPDRVREKLDNRFNKFRTMSGVNSSSFSGQAPAAFSAPIAGAANASEATPQQQPVNDVFKSVAQKIIQQRAANKK